MSNEIPIDIDVVIGLYKNAIAELTHSNIMLQAEIIQLKEELKTLRKKEG